MTKLLSILDFTVIAFLSLFCTDLQPLLYFEWFRAIHPLTWMHPGLMLLLMTSSVVYGQLRVEFAKA